MKNIITAALWVVSFITVSAQTASDAFTLSQSDPLGTARNLGTGNSMFAIGPDFSVLSSNPSGIGAYWRSEFVFTGALTATSYSANLTSNAQNITQDNYAQVSLPNLGFVVVNRPWNDQSLMTSNWAIGLNRTASYQRELQYAGRTPGSMTDAWRENATGFRPDDLNGFEEGLAYSTGAIYDFEGDNIYENDFQLNADYPIHRQENYSSTGGKTELFLGYGANLSNKVLFGASINMPFVNHTISRRYGERDDVENGIPFFNSLEYTSYLNTTGYGINGKIGITVKPVKYAHIAMAVHTPTVLRLSDNYDTTLEYDFTVEGEHDGPLYAESPYGTFQYALRTPWKLMGGAGLILDKFGFLSASISWTNYGSMKYKYDVRGNGNLYEQEEGKVNKAIREEYGKSIDLNIGGEFALNAFRIRAGAGLKQSPFIHDNSFDPSYHAGVGYRGESFFIDLGYALQQQEEGYTPYLTTDAPQPLVVSDGTRHQIALTVGFKF